MADIVLKTYRGGSVTPQDDAIIHQTVIATNGVFKGCQVTYSRGNVLHISQGFGMIKGRFFEVYDTEIPVQLGSTSEMLQGRIYIHLDLSNADAPIQILTQTAPVLGTLDGDEDINYNNTTYDMELATFNVTNTALLNMVQTVSKITGASAGGGASSLQRNAEYSAGDFATCGGTPGWVTLYCTRAGVTAAAEPAVYGSIAKVGDVVVDGTCTFVARDIIKEMDTLSDDLAEAKTDIVLLEEALLEQVDRLPPPVGTIQFSASADVGDEWLRCDGSFVSEKDYPDLVAALGKHTPGVSEFTNAAGDSLMGYFSTSVVYNGCCWVYHIDTKTLHGFSLSGENTVKITVTGAAALTGVVSNPVVLSSCGGTVYLAQSSTATGLANFILYASSGSLDSNSTTLTMKQLDVYTAVKTYREGLSSSSYFWSLNSLPGECFVPEVVQVQVGAATKLYLSLGVVYYNSAASRYQYSVVVLFWTKGDFSTASCGTYSIGYYAASGSVYEETVRSYVFRYAKQLFRFSRKNANEMFYLIADPGSSSSSSYRYIESASIPNALFNNSTTVSVSNVYAMQDDALEASAICYNGIYIYRAMLSDGVLTLRAGKYQPQTPFDPTVGKEQVLPLSIPSVARLFPDSMECSESQGLWMIFVGTGIAFSRKPLDLNSWGYLDTTSVLGAITAFGGIEYDEYSNTLCVTGRSSNNRLRVGLLKFEDIYSYATDGAFLPLMASDGIPAYIKAFEPETTA